MTPLILVTNPVTDIYVQSGIGNLTKLESRASKYMNFSSAQKGFVEVPLQTYVTLIALILEIFLDGLEGIGKLCRV